MLVFELDRTVRAANPGHEGCAVPGLDVWLAS